MGYGSRGHSIDTMGYGVTPVLTREVFRAQYLDSSVTEFILSRAEGLLRNDIPRFEIDSR